MFSKSFIIMLNVLSITIILLLRTASAEEQEVVKLSPELALKVMKFTLPCIEKHNADPDIFKKLLDGTISNDDTSKKFLICFTVSGEFTDEEGHFNIKRMSSMIGNHKKVKAFEEALAECNKVTKESPMETVYEMAMCLDKTSPIKFSL